MRKSQNSASSPGGASSACRAKSSGCCERVGSVFGDMNALVVQDRDLTCQFCKTKTLNKEPRKAGKESKTEERNRSFRTQDGGWRLSSEFESGDCHGCSTVSF